MPIIEKEFMELTAGLDLEKFWLEDIYCFGKTTDKPRCSVSFAPDDHWLFEFMDVGSTVRYYEDKSYRDGLQREANAITERYVGQKFFDEDSWQTSPRRIENLFGSEFEFREHGTPWLTPVTDDAGEFGRILDRVETIDIREWAFPEEFMAEWEARKAVGQPLPELGRGSRGPATIITSVLHPETAFSWFYEYPELMARFRDLIGRKMIELNRALRQFSGNTLGRWWITDDNSALFTRELYREYCYPVLEQVLDALAWELDWRYQHSDSAMGHLLDYQRELGISWVNYGPEVDAGDIRRALPEARIDGHMPPFLLRNGSPEEIERRVIEDFQKAGAGGRLNVTTCGSLSAGTGVGRMRWLMQCVQKHCRYDGSGTERLF